MSPLLKRVLAAALLAGVAVGCSRTAEPEATPSPSPSSEEPTFEVHPVVGERVPAVYHVSSREILGNGSREPLDEAGTGQVMDAIATWLDGHLDDLQRGGDGDLVAIAPAGLILEAEGDEALSPEVQTKIDAVTTDLTNADLPVASARYHLAVYGEAVLEWAMAQVEVTRSDGSTATATFVFGIGENYALSLLLTGPETAVTS